MIELTFKSLIDSEDIVRMVPTTWGELTLCQFYALSKLQEENKENEINVYSILIGVDKEVLSNCSKIEVGTELYTLFEWYWTTKFDCYEYIVPDFVHIKDKEVKVPSGLAVETYGQKLALERVIQDAEGLSEVDIYDKALAIYLQPGYTDSIWDEAKSEEILEDIRTMQLREAWPVAGFFLLRYEQFLKQRKRTSLTIQHRKNQLQGLTTLKNSEAYRQFSVWRKGLIWVVLMWSGMCSFLVGKKYSAIFSTVKQNRSISGTYTIK